MRPFSSCFILVFFSGFLISANAQCGNKCRFRFCNIVDNSKRPKGASILLRGPNTSLSTPICLSGPTKLIMVRSTGEALVSAGGDLTPISKYQPSIYLTPKFKKNFFRLFPIPFLPGKQGIGRKPTKGTQEGFINRLCVVLPITSYDIRLPSGKVSTISRMKPNDCISFRTINAAFVVELNWNSGDDLDLQVIEPDGDVLDKSNIVTEAGKFNNDNNIEACETSPSGKEAAIYSLRKPLDSGSYQVVIRHFKNCGNGPTRWRLRVIVNGVITAVRNGRSSLSNNAIIGSETFTI